MMDMEQTGRSLLLPILVAVTAITWFGCGTSNDESSGELASPVPTVSGEGASGRVPGQPACTRGRAIWSNGSDAIVIALECGTDRPGIAAFAVQRTPIGGERGGEQVGTLAMRVGGPGAVWPRARCQTSNDEWICRVKIDGPSKVVGRWVNAAGGSCAGIVKLIGLTTDACEGSSCEGAPRFDLLFARKPIGCAGS